MGGRQAIRIVWKSQFAATASRAKLWRRRGFGVDRRVGGTIPLKAISRTQPWSGWDTSHDADVQTQEPEAEEQTRLPGPDANERGSQDPQPASPAWQAAPGGDRRLEVRSVGQTHPPEGASGGFRWPPESRVTRSRDIRALLRRGRRKKTFLLDVFFLSSPGSGPRVGLVVPKHGHAAVKRNRLKRRLREICRREVLPELRGGRLQVDILVRARRGAYEGSYQQLRVELVRVVGELCSR